jgi:N5-(carboxyethyl)ornithine synthase
MSLGVIRSTYKENEQRVPIHPDHFNGIPEALRSHMSLERGFGVPFGIPDKELEQQFGGLGTRAEIMRESEIVLLPKPMAEDLRERREGGVLWGWPHCVQQQEITQVAIDRKLTLLAWEAMFTWKNGVSDMHLFYRNNEMAGYCGVIHALGLCGMDGNYGPVQRAVVLSFGSVSRGAVYALRGRGIEEITVCTQRPSYAVHDQVPGCRYKRMAYERGKVVVFSEDGKKYPMLEVLAEADVIVNGILQDIDNPLMFIQKDEERRLKQGALIVDVSCDLKMGFPFARPTSFEEPTFNVGQITYYAVDHTPSYCWRAASWEISRVVVAYLKKVMSGTKTWNDDETLRRAVEIRDGLIQNPRILSYQKRSAEYPHVLQK